MLTWLNDNQGATMSLLTVVYVAATVGMMRSMAKSNALARASLQQSADLDRARLQPYVVFYLDFLSPEGTVTAVLRNVGVTAAYNINVTLTPPLECIWLQKPRETGLTRLPMRFLAPGQQERDLLATIPSFHKHYADPQFRGEVAYEDATGRRYMTPIVLDFNYRKQVGWSHPKSVASEIEKLRKDIGDLTRVIDAIGRDPKR